MKINKAYQFFFNPFHLHHSKKTQVLSLITIVALSIITAGLFTIAFAFVHLKNRNIQLLDNVQDFQLDELRPQEPLPKSSLSSPDFDEEQNCNQESTDCESDVSTTLKILSSNQGFSISSNERIPHDFMPNVYIGTMQGHEVFRADVAKMTQEDIHALSPQALQDHRYVNLETSLILTAKRVGHAFSLKGNLKLDGLVDTTYEGFNEVFTIPMLADSFDTFSKKHPDLINEEMVQWILEHFTQSTLSDTVAQKDLKKMTAELKDPNFTGPLCVTTGYNWHSTYVIFFKDLVFYMNRGAGQYELRVEGEALPEFNPDGIHIFKASNPLHLSEAMASKIFQRMKYNRYQGLKFDHFQKEMGLLYIDTIRTKEQQSGVCTYVSPKMGIRTLMALYYLRNYQKILPIDLDEAFEKAHPIYKAWTRFDRNYVFEQLVKEIEDSHLESGQHKKVHKVLTTIGKDLFHQKKHQLGIKKCSLLKPLLFPPNFI